MGKPKNGAKKQEDISMNATRKFAVLDYPGVTQPTFEKDEPNVSNNNNNQQKSTAAAAAGGGQQGRRAKAGSGPKMDASQQTLIGGDSFPGRTPNPDWLKDRLAVYETIAQRRQVELDTKQAIPIAITLPDGTVLTQHSKTQEPFLAWKTSPVDVAQSISQGLADSAVVARVTYASFVPDYSIWEDGMEGVDMMLDAMGETEEVEPAQDQESEQAVNGQQKTLLWDMTRPLVGPVAKMEFLKFGQDKDATTVFWHSSSHIMGEALEHSYGSKLTIGPPLDGGFYYDSFMGSDALREDDCRYSRMLERNKQPNGNHFSLCLVPNHKDSHTLVCLFVCFYIVFCFGIHNK